MRHQHVVIAASDGLATVTMNRPERRNTLSEAHMTELLGALKDVSDARDTRAIILAAAGPVFPAGHDFGDLAVASEDATVATPGGKGGWFCTTPMVAVARAVAPKRALEMLLTGDPIDARTALAWGLVNRVEPADRLVEETEALARAASRGSLASKALGKRAFYDTADLDVESAYARACDVMASSAMTADGREAIVSFLEKRPGVYPPRR